MKQKVSLIDEMSSFDDLPKRDRNHALEEEAEATFQALISHIGTSADESSIYYEDEFDFFEFVPLTDISLLENGRIQADSPDEILRFLNSTINNAGTIDVMGGGLHFASTDLFNRDDLFVSWGTMRFDFYDYSDGGFFYNDGNVVQFGGVIDVDVSTYNAGAMQLLEGVAEFNSFTQANGGFLWIGDADVTFTSSASGTIYTQQGDADVIIEDNSSFNASIRDFGLGDALHFTELDDAGDIDLSYEDLGFFGRLTVTDGSTSVSVDFQQVGTTQATVDDFVFASSDFGGVEITTGLDLI